MDDIRKKPPLGGYRDMTTSLHLTSGLLIKVRAAATATNFNQSDIFRIGVERYIENDLVPNMLKSERARYDMALKMEREALQIKG
jgi:hypothetical protein